MNATFCRSLPLTRKHPRAVTSYGLLRWWQVLLMLGAIFLSHAAPAQDACALQCSSKEAAWCTGADPDCVFNYRDCMQACERPSSTVVQRSNILPCQYAQNALRPCGNQQQATAPTGVDGRLVGIWEIVTPTPAGVARWIWAIHPDGTYSFHAEGPNPVQAHSGTFAAANGHYVLNSTTMTWNDAGTYEFQGSATMIAVGKLGKGVWQRLLPKATVVPGSRITVRK